MDISVWKEAETLVSLITPTVRSNQARDAVADFLRRILCRKRDDYLLLMSGSCCSKTYLPDGDVDLVLSTATLLQTAPDMQHLTDIFAALCEEIYRKEGDGSKQQYTQYVSPADFTVRNVEFINARTKLLHCVVDNVSVDVTINQVDIFASSPVKRNQFCLPHFISVRWVSSLVFSFSKKWIAQSVIIISLNTVSCLSRYQFTLSFLLFHMP